MQSLLRFAFAPLPRALDQVAVDAGLLVLRATVGGMMLFGHGLGKVGRLFTEPTSFADPIGVGPVFSLLLAAFAEAGCAALLMAGLATRIAALPLLVTMLVAGFVVHADDPWKTKELAVLYAVPTLALVFTGAGRYSVDAWWLAKLAARGSATQAPESKATGA